MAGMFTGRLGHFYHNAGIQRSDTGNDKGPEVETARPLVIWSGKCLSMKLGLSIKLSPYSLLLKDIHVSLSKKNPDYSGSDC